MIFHRHRWQYSEDRKRRACFSCRKAEEDYGDFWMAHKVMSLTYFLGLTPAPPAPPPEYMKPSIPG